MVCARRRLPARSGTVARVPRHDITVRRRSGRVRNSCVPHLGSGARTVAVRLEDGDHPLTETDDGVWEGQAPAASGDDYRFVLDGGDAWPDPCSRWQPQGVRGPSRVLDTSAFEIEPGPALALEELVLYELHVGTFSREGTFDGVIPRLAGLRELGVTAIELMPVATFPGSRGWGYDGLYPFAPHPAYGGPEGLARLVDAAHREGLGVVLDVVYNHIGPGNEALRAFGPYFTDRFGETPWGEALDFSQARRARVGDPERRALGARLRDRRPPARRRSRRPGRLRSPRARRARRPRPCRHPGALVISEMGAARFPPAPGMGSRRDVARQPPSRAARCPDRGAGRVLRGLRRLDVPHRGRALPAGGLEDRGVRPESRPGRQPRDRRQAPAREAARRGGRRALQPLHAAPLPGRGVRRDRAVPVLHRPQRPVHRGLRRARAGGASSPTSPASRARCPTRRTRRPSSAPG